MIVYSSAKDRSLPSGALWALGVFDGLHRGHTALFECARSAAKERAIPWGIWSPKGAKSSPLVTPRFDRPQFFMRAGAQFYVEEPFEEIKDLSPEEFFDVYLVGKYRAAALACGENFTFGKDRSGDAGLLARLCAERGVELFVVPTVYDGETPVSSTELRAALGSADIRRANALSGRPCGFFSTVQPGRQVGRTLGFPTLNFPLPENSPWALPGARGVYFAGVKRGDGQILPALANIGVHPTFGEAEEPLCEAHLLEAPVIDLPQDAVAYIEFYDYLRPEKKFGTPGELAAQIKKDLAAARVFFAHKTEH